MIKLTKHYFRLILTLALLIAYQGLALATTNSTAIPPNIQKIITIQGVTEYRLDNGLQILLAPDSAKSQVTVNMSYKVGSRQEGSGETGMAHLLEHLLFRGSTNFPDALAEFSRRGMAANGSTTADLTNYFASFNSDQQTLDWFLSWQADAMHNASISQTDLDAEMTVVRNEMERGENSPFSSLLQQVNAAAYVWHPYGRSVIGARSDIENINVQQLRNFYNTYYQPDNAVLIITGDFAPEPTLAAIAKNFGSMAKPSRIIPHEYTIEPAQQGPRSVVLERIGGSPLAIVQYHIPSASHDAYTNLAIGTAMLSDAPSGPLYKQLVDTHQANSIFGFARAMYQPGYALFGAQIQEDQSAQKVLKQLQELISPKTIATLDDIGLNRIKTAWLNDWQQIYNNQSSLAAALSDAVANGDWRLFFIEPLRIKSASLNEIQQDLNDWLIPNNRTSGLYIPSKNPIYAPTNSPAQLNKWLNELETGTQRPAIESFDTSPLAIQQASQVSDLVLNSGTVKLALLPKQTSGKVIYANMNIGFGTLQDYNGLGLVPQITANMLMRGTADMDRQAIEDKLNNLDSELYFSAQDNQLIIAMRSSTENFDELLDLVFNILKNPSFPENELNKIKSALSTSINNQASNPLWLVSNKLQRNQQPWATDDIRYVPDIAESIQMIKTLERKHLVDFYNNFYGAGTINFAAVGQLKPDLIKQNLTKNLQNWRIAPKFERIPQPWYPIEPRQFNIPTPGKANANYLADLSLQLQDNSPEWIPLFLANYLIGGSEDSKLWQNIRSQQGLSYSVGSSIYSSPWEPYAKWSIFASMAPENTSKLTSSIQTVLANTIEQGFSQNEVELGVKSLLNFLQLGRSSDASLASKWLRYLNLGRNFNWDQKVIDRLQTLTADEVNQVMRKYLKPSNLSIAVAFDG